MMKLNKLIAITVLSTTAFTITAFASEGLTEREIEEGSLAGSVQVAADRYDALDYNQDLVDQWDEPIAAVGGSWVCTTADISAHNFDKITELCRQARTAIDEVKA